MTALSDEELVAKYRAAGGRPMGTPFADELFKRHYSRVGLWCLRVTGNRETATDLAQEVLAKAWMHLDHFRADSKFTTWLCAIARNHCFNALRSRARMPEDGVETEKLEALGALSAGFDSDLERSQMLEIAQGLMASELSPLEAQVMTLHYAEDLPLDAISILLKMDNASGAKAYIVSAKRKLKIAVDRWSARSAGARARGRSGHE